MDIFFSPQILALMAASLPIYWRVLKDDQNRLLFVTAISAGALVYLQPGFAFLLLTLTIATERFSILLRPGSGQRTTTKLAVAATVLLGILLVGKYAKGISRPLGISYLIFKLLQILFDSYRGTLKESSALGVASFAAFLPTYPAGPIESYQGFHDRRCRKFDPVLFSCGARRVVWGYFKKLVLVEVLLKKGPILLVLPDAFQPNALNIGSPHTAILYCCLMYLHAYLDLSAYSDLAIGVSALFGFRIIENFDNPLTKTNLAGFWRSWHISLATWCRNQVFFPVFGMTRKPWLAVYASMVTMGLWHNISWSWLAWGIYHGSGLVWLSYWERLKKKKPLLKQSFSSRPGTLLSWALTLFYVSFGYSFVSIPDIQKALRIFFLAWSGLVRWS